METIIPAMHTKNYLRVWSKLFQTFMYARIEIKLIFGQKVY